MSLFCASSRRRLAALLFVILGALCSHGDATPPPPTVQAVDAGVSLINNSNGVQSVLPNGQVLVVTSNAANGWTPTLQRYSPDGTLDSTFDTSALAAREIDQLVPLASGQTLVFGRFGADPNAGSGAGAQGPIITAPVDTGGDTMVATPALVPDPEVIERINSDGSVDSSYTPVTLSSDWVDTLRTLPDGRTIYSAYQSSEDQNGNWVGSYSLVRLGADGSLDSTYNPSLPPGDDLVDFQVGADGRAVLGFDSGTLLRVNNDGAIDGSFKPTLPAASEIDAFAILADGRILVATSLNDDDDDSDDDAVSVETLTLIESGGATNGAFSVTLLGDVDSLYALSGGGALAVGDFETKSGNDWYGVEKIGEDGTETEILGPDSTDNLGDVAPTPDGGFALGVTADDANGNSDAILALYDAKGAAVSRETLGAAFSVSSVTVRPDGGFYVDLVTTLAPFYSLGLDGIAPPPAAGASVVKADCTVTISAARGEAFAGTRRKAKFLLTRVGDISRDVKVHYKVKGSAIGGKDYKPLTGTRRIRAGQRTAQISVRPMGARFHHVSPGGVSVRLVLAKRSTYNVGKKSAARVRLLNHADAVEQP